MRIRSPIISLQNGLGNPSVLARGNTYGGDRSVEQRVHGGVVTFNVRQGRQYGDEYGPDDYVQTTSGPIVISRNMRLYLMPTMITPQ